MRLHRTVAAIASAVLLTTTLGLTVASPAQASHSCGSPAYQNVDDGYGILKGAYNLKTAPYSDCGNVAYLGKGTKLYIWCQVINEYDNFWVYTRVAGTETRGWMSWDNFSEVTGNRGHCTPYLL
ncbi:hypothetical protein ACH495_31180 [Micromonospora sp. NPDC018662]|uniref:hypothetical protein n=1 Tax=Micromonospora sp. NPDC018662 TaxID=3364238 RepID=UPI00378E757E